ncbi:MAG TPA: polysaccharide deacetylase [Bacteroidetes bacterium]|nr:polysaccharide deacetylase [Bacteroidota bacterium]
MKPGVYITIDVECSMGGAWGDNSLRPIPPRLGMMGEYNGLFYGIPLICNILAEHNLKATFFLEPFNDELGYKGETEPVCHFLIDHGHDVQLHIHPNHFHFGLYKSGKPYPMTDQMAHLPLKKQLDLIEKGAYRIEKWCGRRPVAFRAGNMGASEETLKAVSRAGLLLDSSYTFPYLRGQCLFKDREEYNGAKWYGDVLEVALSGFKQVAIQGLIKPSQPLDLMGTSFNECKYIIKKICEAGADAVLILHSFSLFKVKDVQYNGGRPNRVVIGRFKRLCKWLAENNTKYPIRTFSELAEMIQKKGYRPKRVKPCSYPNPLVTVTRKFIQGLNRFYWD